MKAVLTDKGYVFYWCDGCKTYHHINIIPPDGWDFNNNLESPTLSPSINHTKDDVTLCHHWLKDGMIQYLADSRHTLAGQTIPLKDLVTNMHPDNDTQSLYDSLRYNIYGNYYGNIVE